MKILPYISISILSILYSCSPETEDILPVNEVAHLKSIQAMENESHLVELYSPSGQLQQGYNKISLRIKNKSDQKYLANTSIQWTPIMHMETMQHSSPFSEVNKTPNTESLYEGFIVFQMPGNPTEYWELTLEYTVNEVNYTVTDKLAVPESSKRRVTVFTGIDGTRYILALIDPETPKVTTNDLSMGVFRMDNMMSFPVINGYKIYVDPRMPSMGNHSSPNNIDLTQSLEDNFYYGKLNLTMSGYWRINLQLENTFGEIVKGEAISDTNETSSLYLELEF